MLQGLWLIPALPLVGFLVLVGLGARLSRKGAALVGVGSVGMSAVVALLAGGSFIHSPPRGGSYSQTLWAWLSVQGFAPHVSLYLDSLSLIMVLVVTGVGFLIHLYSAEFMEDDEGFSRFFAYMNLFVASMLVLVLADDLLLLYLGWEGVGLCSYLLIGFWYQDPNNGRAARKAFIVTRVGDTAMAIGLFILFTELGTLEIQEVMRRASQEWSVGSEVATVAALLLLAGALGKSAQLPLQTWLPDAMAGPTPVSALIHAATMVTAGFYLIARTHGLFLMAPAALSLVAIVGALTLLLAACSALVQRDLKRILAYSTMSQIGYMFLALGVGAWSAAAFHFMTHAFFKALLFLCAGVVILSLHHEHDIYKMGGLRRELPVTFWAFLIGGAALAGFPLVTAGFYSKDWILWQAWASARGSVWLWAAGLSGAFLTSVYVFRAVFIVFFGEVRGRLSKKPGKRMEVPLMILAVLSVGAGFLELPRTLGDLPLFSRFMETALPGSEELHGSVAAEVVLQLVAVMVSLLGIYIAYVFYRGKAPTQSWLGSSLAVSLRRLWFEGWGFDRLYDGLVVRPFLWAARFNKDDLIDSVYDGIAKMAERFHGSLRRTQTGRVRWYAAGIAVGCVVVIALVVFL